MARNTLIIWQILQLNGKSSIPTVQNIKYTTLILTKQIQYIDGEYYNMNVVRVQSTPLYGGHTCIHHISELTSNNNIDRTITLVKQ